jgi:hypothetical protein
MTCGVARSLCIHHNDSRCQIRELGNILKAFWVTNNRPERDLLSSQMMTQTLEKMHQSSDEMNIHRNDCDYNCAIDKNSADDMRK